MREAAKIVMYPWEVWVKSPKGADWQWGKYKTRWGATIARFLSGPKTYVKPAAWNHG